MYRYCRYIEADDCRIAAGGTLSCTSLHGHRIERPNNADTDFSSSGNGWADNETAAHNTPTETHEDYGEFRDALLANYKHLWKGNDVQWLRTAAEVRPRNR
jgi:hypothetical protein